MANPTSFNSYFYFPSEGLQYLLNIVPRNSQTAPSTLYLGLTASTWSSISGAVAAGSGVVLNNAVSPGNFIVQETSFTSYSRLTVAATGWGVPTSGNVTIGSDANIPVQYVTWTGSPLTFTNGGGTYSSINGIFVSISGAAGTTSSGGGTVLWYAPFSDLSTVTLASGDTLTVTPTWQQASFPN